MCKADEGCTDRKINRNDGKRDCVRKLYNFLLKCFGKPLNLNSFWTIESWSFLLINAVILKDFLWKAIVIFFPQLGQVSLALKLQSIPTTLNCHIHTCLLVQAYFKLRLDVRGPLISKVCFQLISLNKFPLQVWRSTKCFGQILCLLCLCIVWMVTCCKMWDACSSLDIFLWSFVTDCRCSKIAFQAILEHRQHLGKFTIIPTDPCL